VESPGSAYGPSPKKGSGWERGEVEAFGYLLGGVALGVGLGATELEVFQTTTAWLIPLAVGIVCFLASFARLTRIERAHTDSPDHRSP
jgi:hypothetical protein